MKLEADILLRKYENVMGGYTSLLSFRLMNLCVKADPGSLLAVQVELYGEQKNIEDVAKVSVSADDTMDVYPLHEDLLTSIGKGVMHVHPEFKQSLQTVHIESKNKDLRFLRLVVPEVDDDRRDALNNAIDVFYNETKTQYEVNRNKYLIELNSVMKGEPKADIDEAKETFDKIYDNNLDLAQRSIDEKQKEIEEAYQRYLTKMTEKAQAEKEQAAAEGEAVTHSLKMPLENN
jgi:ribosome recycling factor